MDCHKNLSPGNAATESAHRALRRLLRRAGPGTIQRVEQALGLSRDAIGQWRRRGKLEFDALVDVLTILDYPLESFFTALFPPKPRSDENRVPIVLAANYALGHCYDQPVDAISELRRAALTHDAGQDWYFSMVVGVVLLVFEMGELSERWLRRAAALSPNSLSRAKCLLRISPLLTLRYRKPEDGIRLATEQATTLSADSEHLALALYYQAIAHFRLSSFQCFLELIETALAEPEISRRTAASAHQLRAMYYHQTGYLTEAEDDLNKAALFANDAWSAGHIIWQRAAMEQNPALYDMAIATFHQHPYHALRAGLERIRHFGDENTFELLIARCGHVFGKILTTVRDSYRSKRGLNRNPRYQEIWDRWRRSQTAMFSLPNLLAP